MGLSKCLAESDGLKKRFFAYSARLAWDSSDPTAYDRLADRSHFSQRFEATVSSDGTSIEGRWEKRQSGGIWEHDFNVTYSRL